MAGDLDPAPMAPEEYTDNLIGFLEVVWGEGYLSPGGDEEVARVVEGLDLAGKTLLDIGCGTGGIALLLAERHGAGHVVGVDIEAGVLAKATARAGLRGLASRVEFRRVAPGPLPFADGSFDVVFSKDAMIHIPDKEALFADVFRLLRPGGWFAAGDWLIGHDGEPSAAMQHYLAMEGLSFGMASPARYRRALEGAGFGEVRLVDRNPWYREAAARELAGLKGSLYQRAVAAVGRQTVDHNLGTWSAMLAVLNTGEHCPHHLRGRKPLKP
jgi:phosphoethanolamine N-methyltransferase